MVRAERTNSRERIKAGMRLERRKNSKRPVSCNLESKVERERAQSKGWVKARICRRRKYFFPLLLKVLGWVSNKRQINKRKACKFI